MIGNHNNDTFRAENSNTPRHLAEFWMIEPGICAGIKFGKRGIYTGFFPSGSVEHVEIITV